MRVIGGLFRSRKLIAPPGSATRPTSDRLRETLFNILAPRLHACRLADLYAGTGAVGIEAISRGATHVWFAEKSPAALSTLRANLGALKVLHGFTLEERGTGALLQRLAKLPGNLDILFLDPPYELTNEYQATLDLLGSAIGPRILAPTGIVVAEHAAKSPLPETFGALRKFRHVKQGEAALTFFQFPQADPQP